MDLDGFIEKLQEIRREHGNVRELIVEVRDVQATVTDVSWDKDLVEFVWVETES